MSFISGVARRVDFHLSKNLRRISGRLTNAIPVHGVKVPLGEHLTPVILGALYRGEYEGKELGVLSDRLEQSDVVLELGGGLGFLSTFCAKRIGSDRVFVYEANPAMEGPIRRLYRINGVTPALNMCALGPTAGTMTFVVGKDFWESSSVKSHVKGPEKTMEVPQRAFGAEVAGLPRRPNFLVVDIEGGEYDLLPNIPLDGVTKILCESHSEVPADNAKLVSALAEKGLRLDERRSQHPLLYFHRGANA